MEKNLDSLNTFIIILLSVVNTVCQNYQRCNLSEMYKH